MNVLHHPSKHDDLLNYQLKRLVNLGGAPAIRLCEGRYGVSRTEWRLVAALAEDGPLSPSDLSERIQLDLARVSYILRSLVDKGLVSREAQPDDRRRATIAVTQAGKQLYADLFPQLAEINKRIMTVLDEREGACLEDFLRRLTCRAREIFDQGGGVDVRANRRLGSSSRRAMENKASEIKRT